MGAGGNARRKRGVRGVSRVARDAGALAGSRPTAADGHARGEAMTHGSRGKCGCLDVEREHLAHPGARYHVCNCWSALEELPDHV